MPYGPVGFVFMVIGLLIALANILDFYLLNMKVGGGYWIAAGLVFVTGLSLWALANFEFGVGYLWVVILFIVLFGKRFYGAYVGPYLSKGKEK